MTFETLLLSTAVLLLLVLLIAASVRVARLRRELARTQSVLANVIRDASWAQSEAQSRQNDILELQIRLDRLDGGHDPFARVG